MRYAKLLICILCAVAITLASTVFKIEGGSEQLVRVAIAAPELSSGAKSALFESSGDMTVVLSGTRFKCRRLKITSGSALSLEAYDQSGTLTATKKAAAAIIEGRLTLDGIAYDGYFEVSLLGGQIKIVNILPLEDYVKGVMPYEIGSNQHDEITKASSIMIRTVALHKKHSEYGFDVCATSCCQNYKGHKISDERLDRIAESTKGIVLTYEGEPISCAYCNSNGGASCPSSDAWGGSPVPYLSSVVLDEGEFADVWQVTMTAHEINERAAAKGAKGAITDISLERSEAGFVKRVVLTDTTGKQIIVEDTSKVRKLFGLKSARFDISYYLTGDILTSDGLKDTAVSVITSDGVAEIDTIHLPAEGESEYTVNVVFDGSGHGHCVGFSLAGAKMLVRRGYKYEAIATFYFPGAELSRI